MKISIWNVLKRSKPVPMLLNSWLVAIRVLSDKNKLVYSQIQESGEDSYVSFKSMIYCCGKRLGEMRIKVFENNTSNICH